jgi:uncharacterized protein YjiS (DUF1127 family)
MFEDPDPRLSLSSYEFERWARVARAAAMSASLRGALRKLAGWRHTLLGACSRLAARLAAVVCEWYAIRALQCLDDRTLADLGVSRGEIAFVVRGGRPARERPATPASLRARRQRQQAA